MGIAAITPIGSEKPCKTKKYGHASRVESPAPKRYDMTNAGTNDAAAPLATLLRNALPGSDRDHVWQAQGLAAGRNALRPEVFLSAIALAAIVIFWLRVLTLNDQYASKTR